MNRRLLSMLLVGLLLVPSSAFAVGNTAADTRGEAELTVELPDNRVTAGEVTTLELQVGNTATVESSSRNPGDIQRVTSARGVRVRLRSGNAPFEVRTNARVLGTVVDGAVAPAAFEIVVDEDAEPGSYRVPVHVQYEFTERIGENDEFRDTDGVEETLYVRVRVVEDARFEVVETTTDAAVGGSGTVRMTVENTGDAAAEDATLTVESQNPTLTFGGSQSADTHVGDWEPGERRTFAFGANVAGDAEPRSLALRTTVEYEDVDGVPTTSTLSTGVRPAGEGTIRILSAETTAAAGDTGRLTLELENTAERPLQGAELQLESSNAALTFGSSPTVSAFVGEWDPGEIREVTVESTFAETAEQQAYSVDATVTYDAADGRTASTRSVTFGARPAADQSFSLGTTNGSLRVDSEGTLSGTVVNNGPATIENAVLVLEDSGTNLNAAEREFAIGDLQAGGTSNFDYELDVTSSARPGARQFAYRVRYDDTDGDTRQSDPLYARYEVGPARNEFGIEPIEATLEAGSSGTVRLSVTNNGDTTLTNINAKAFVDDPISAETDEAYVSSLEPGESAEIAFDLSAGADAPARDRPLEIDFQYDEPDGDTKLSDTYQMPLTVQESSGGGLPLSLIGVGIVLAFGLIGGVLYMRR